MTVTLTAPSVRSAWIGPKRALPALGLAGVCVAAGLTDVSADDGQVLCPYRLATGGWCPGCGCTRALGALVQGDLRASLVLNPWMLVVLAQATVMAGWFLGAPEKAWAWWSANDGIVLRVNLVIAAAFWFTRLATGAIPLPFS